MANSVKKKIKILFIHHATGWGGAPISMLKTIKSLDTELFSAEVLLLHDSDVREILEENCIKVNIAKSNFYRHFYSSYAHSDANNVKWYRMDRQVKLITSWFLSRYYYAYRELKKYDFDIVHLNSSTLTDWLAPSSAKGKVIIHIREPFSKGNLGIRYAFFRNQMKKYADKIIAISNDNANRINIIDKISVVYNFIEIQENSESENHSKEKNQVVYLGGYHSIKGFHTVVDSLDYLNINVKIAFCGDYLENIPHKGVFNSIKKKIKSYMPFHQKLNAAILKIKNHPNAIYLGFVRNPSEIIEESLFLISPFAKPHFARPVIEAFAKRKCVIGSNVKGMDEIIDHKVNGLIVEKDDPIRLAEAINYLHENPNERYKMGQQGFKKALTHFSTTNILLIQDIYMELANNNKIL